MYTELCMEIVKYVINCALFSFVFSFYYNNNKSIILGRSLQYKGISYKKKILPVAGHHRLFCMHSPTNERRPFYTLYFP